MLNMRLWREGPFLRFFVGSSVSYAGDWLNTVASAVLIYRLTGRVALVAATLAVSVVPRVLLTPIGGALADRFARRALLLSLDAARVVVALLPLLAHDRNMLWFVYAAAVLLQAGACVYNSAQAAYVPHLVPDDLLEPANAAYAAMRDIAMFVGPALAGIIVGMWGTSAAFVGNAASFAVVALVVLTLPRTPKASTVALNLSALLGGYVAIARRYPRVSALCVSYLASVVPLYFFLSILVIYVGRLDQPTTFIGAMYAAAGIGGAIGGLGMGHFLRRLSFAAAIAVFAAEVPLLIVLTVAYHPAVALVVFAGSTAAGTAGDVIFTVNVQRHVAPQEQGRAFGMLFWCIALGQLGGSGLGIATTTQSAMPTLVLISLFALPVVLGGIFASIRAGQPLVARSGAAAAGSPQ